MKRLIATVATSLVLLSAFASVPRAAATEGQSTSTLTARQQVLHALNRLGFGPRPGDVDRVLAIGLSRYIDEQLHPERISDRASEARLVSLETLHMSNQQLFDKFAKPMLEARRARKKNAAAAPAMKAEENAGPEDEARAAAAMRAKIPYDQRPRRVLEELNESRVVRAVYSDRQLNELMVDFWMNHFNVFANKNADRVLVTGYERDVIRPRVWGKFSDLLMATAKSPAMLTYLDNARSVADENHRQMPALQSQRLGRGRGGFGNDRAMSRGAQMPAKFKSAGLNENYARELMELHTLGVDGGYSQKDVTEMARLLTGWSIRPPQQGNIEFVFRAPMHDAGAKKVLGYTFPAGGGMEEGERMIQILARHPATAHHISYQLCQRLVADEPPAALVDRVAKRFLATDGDLRETVRAVIDSPEFFSPQFYRAKVKSPFEYVVSAIRATDGDTDGRAVAMQIAKMGEPLYLCQPPTGYSDTAATWVNSGALVARLNFALALADDQVPGTRLKGSDQSQRDPIAFFSRELIGGDLSPSTRQVIDQKLSEPPTSSGLPMSSQRKSTLIAGLILGSPEFQRQ